jgi:hypothetical protein
VDDGKANEASDQSHGFGAQRIGKTSILVDYLDPRELAPTW